MRLLVYALGSAGAYSEINNLLLAQAYADLGGARLAIDGSRWIGSSRAGWRDYFDSGLTCRWSSPLAADQRIARGRRQRLWLWLSWLLSAGRIVPMAGFWDRMRDPAVWRRAGVPDVGPASLFERKRQALDRLYRFRPGVRREIAELIDAIGLPETYAAMHIRRGDKITSGEMSELALRDYVEALDGLACDDLYVATDDHDALRALRQLLPARWRVHSLARPDDAGGYDQNAFNQASPAQRRAEMLRLFAEVEVLSRADRLICTFSSNVSRFVALRLGLARCRSLDEAWHPW